MKEIQQLIIDVHKLRQTLFMHYTLKLIRFKYLSMHHNKLYIQYSVFIFQKLKLKLFIIFISFFGNLVVVRQKSKKNDVKL